MKEVSELVLDGIRELVTMGIGRSAGSLNDLTGHHVTISVPRISLAGIDEIETKIPHTDLPFSLVSLEYSGALSGTAALLFPRTSAESIFYLLTGESERRPEIEELWRMTILEVGNIIINAVMGSISNNIGRTLKFHLPQYHEDSLFHLLSMPIYRESDTVIVACSHFFVQAPDITGEIVLFLADTSIDLLAGFIGEKTGDEGAGMNGRVG